MIKKKYYLLPKIISLFFILFLFSIKVQAISNISINLKAPIHEGVIEDKELNIDGEIESISKIKLAYVYIDNNNVGQAKLNELEFKENTYKTKLEYNKDISSLKDGVYNLKILAIDEQDNKEEKEISIKIKRNQEEVSDNRVNIYEEQLVENDKNIVQRNLEYDNVKISSTEKALTTVYNKATISNLEVSLNGTVVTNGKLEQGKTYTIKGNGNSANGVLYQFWIKDPYTQVWQMIRDYGTGNSMNWTPTRTGKYLVGIHVKDKNSKERLDDHKYVEYNVEQSSSKATISNLEVSLNGTVVANGKLEQGKTYTIKGNGNSANGVLYQFWIKDPYTQVWQMIRDYGTGNSMNWTPIGAGKYLVGIHVKDKNSKERLDDHKYVEYNAIGSNKNYKNSYYNITLDEMINRQMANTPAYHMYIADKNIYEWRYAIIKNGKKGYSTDINGVNWIQSDQQYDYIKSRAREYIDPTNQIYDSIGQYQFLQLSYNECTTAEQLNNILKGKGVLEGKGQAFIDAGKESNVSPIYLIAHSLLETGNGTSTLAKGVVVNGKTVYNLFGINAVDSDPIGQGSKYAYEQGWFSVDLAIKGGAKWISSRYINNPIYKQDTLYKMRWNPDNPTVHQYATDIRWAYNQVSNIKKVIDQLQNVVLNFDVPVFK